TTGRIEREVYRLELEDGTVLRASAKHPWLIAAKAAGNQRWRTSEQLEEDLARGCTRYLPRFVRPWETLDTRQAGYLAGLFDGEGHLSFANRTLTVGFAQNDGRVLRSARSLLAGNALVTTVRPNPASRVQHVRLRGGWQECARFLGAVRPERLLMRFSER